MARLLFGDQLDGVRGVLNSLPGQDRLNTWMAETFDGVHIWRLDKVFVVIYNQRIELARDDVCCADRGQQDGRQGRGAH